jgi:hypothetical protein
MAGYMACIGRQSAEAKSVGAGACWRNDGGIWGRQGHALGFGTADEPAGVGRPGLWARGNAGPHVVGCAHA